MYHFLRVLSAFLILMGCTRMLHAENTWTEVDSPHFRVLTDSSARNAKQVAQDFEQIRYVFVLRFHNENVTSGAPLTVVAARDEQTMRKLEPFLWSKHTDGSMIAGNFFRLWESQYAVVRMDEWSKGFGKEVAFHEYTHSVLHANAHWLPMWLDEGLAEFYAYTRFENQRILVGAPSERFGILRSRPLIPVMDMMDRAKLKRLYQDQAQTQLFYAESWAMVHYMTFGPGMDGGDKLQSFFRLLQDGTSQPEAFRQTFGDPAAFDKGLQKYTSLFQFSAGVLPVPPALEKPALTQRELTPAETDLALGEFAAAVHRDPTAHDLLEKSIALDPNLAQAHQALGFVDFRNGDDALARTEWSAALKLNPQLDRALFAETMSGTPLAQQTPAELDATESALEKVVALAPNFAPAWVELARIAWKHGTMQVAFEDSKRAETLEPWRAGYHLLTGEILLHGGHPELAAGYAEYVAKRWDGPDRDEAVDLWKQVPAEARANTARLSYDLKDGVLLARGFLASETCGKPGSPEMFSLDVTALQSAQPMHFVSDGDLAIGFSDTLWWGEDHFSQCRHLAGQPVMVIYRKGAAGAPNTVVDMEVRDPWPTGFEGVAASTATPLETSAAAATGGSPSLKQ